jgi:hypothetical protein
MDVSQTCRYLGFDSNSSFVQNRTFDEYVTRACK